MDTNRKELAPTQSLLSAKDLVQKPLNYDKYRDLENELTQADIIAFITNMGNKYKEEHQT